MDQSSIDLASLHSSASGEDESWGSSAVDWFARGIPAALGSGLISMANTGIALGNVLGADADKINTGAALASFDDDIGLYYQQHSQGADLGGFLLTSLAPGMVGIKALKMLQGGTAGVNASRIAGLLKTTIPEAEALAPLGNPSFLSNPLAYAARKEAFFTEKTLNKIRLSANEIFSAVDRDKLAAIAFGAADQALQGAAFETAVLLTMNQSPIISKEDEGYFTSLAGNLWEIPVAAATQGVLGGLLGGVGLAGKFAGFKKDVDRAQFAAAHSGRLGASNLAEQPGTAIAVDISLLANKIEEYNLRKAQGTLTAADHTIYQNNIKRFTNQLRAQGTKELSTSEDAQAVQGIFDLILKSDDVGETANLILGAARKVRGIGTDTEELDPNAIRMFLNADQMVDRVANLIVKRGRIAPGEFDSVSYDQRAEWAGMVNKDGSHVYDAWKDTAGNYHAIDESRYVRQLMKSGFKKKNFDIILKFTGDGAGTASTTAFPVIGDLAKGGGVIVSEDGTELLVGAQKAVYGFPENGFNPIENPAITSNAQFVHASLRPLEKLASETDGALHISPGDVPLLEAAARKGFGGDVYLGNTNITGSLREELQAAKIVQRQVLMEEGHGFDRIARELNTTRDWAETGRGDGFILEGEDHTKPLHAAITYSTGFVPNKHYIRGIADLQTFVRLGKEMHEKTVAAIMGPAAAQLPNTKGALLDLTTLPETSNLFRSTSGEFGTTLSYFQQAGRVLDTLLRENTKAIYQSLQGVEAAIKGDANALREGNIVLNKFRSSKEPVYKYDPEGGDIESGGDVHFMPKNIYKKIMKAEKEGDEEAISELLGDKEVWKIDNKIVEDYFLRNIELTSSRANQWNLIFASRGLPQRWDPDRVYVPPLDTTKHSHVNFIKEKMQIPGKTEEVGVVVAHTAGDLEAKVAQLKAAYGDRFEIYTKSDIKLYKEAQGTWETGAMLGDALTDQAMRNEGLLYEFQPRVDAEFVNDFNNFHWRQENNILRNTMELKYAQEFAEIRAMSKRFDESKFGPKGDAAAKNPYNQYIKTALNISNFDRYNSVWGKINSAVEGAGSGMIDAWKNAVGQAMEGKIDWEAANATAEKYGFRAPYKDAIASVVQPKIPNARALEPAIAKINGVISSITLGLDFLNSVVNVMSFPIMALSEMKSLQQQLLREKGAGAQDLINRIKAMTTVQIPGRPEMLMPSPMKLLTNSIIRLAKDDGTLLRYYKEIGAVKTPDALGTAVVDAARLTPESLTSLENFATHANNVVSKAIEYGKIATGHNKAEEWVRFLAADMMKQIIDSVGIKGGDAAAYINTYVDRIHGNYLASQRPHLFQGVVGQAISLFQTYQFNMMQSLVRHVGAGDKTSAAMLFGLQNSIFGVQGNPAFYILNQAIGNSNPEHLDFLSGSRELVGKDVSDWVMYGLGSNALHTSLYNRGDLTPRYVTVVPTQLKDIPAISIPVKAITSFYDAAAQMLHGARAGDAIMNGLSHFGANRPLSGLAQLAQGYRTSSKGDLISAYNDIDGWTIAAKLSGGEELNRAIAMDAYYRNLAYKAYDQEKRADLGKIVKQTMYNGHLPTEDQVTSFMQQYARSGGQPQSFNRWMQQEFKHATQSQMDVMKSHVNSAAGRRQATMMGADVDYSFQPSASPTEIATTGEE